MKFNVGDRPCGQAPWPQSCRQKSPTKLLLGRLRALRGGGHWGVDRRPGGDEGSRVSVKRNLPAKAAKFKVRDEVGILG